MTALALPASSLPTKSRFLQPTAHPSPGGGSHPLDDEPSFIRLSPVPLLVDQPCLVAQDILFFSLIAELPSTQLLSR